MKTERIPEGQWIELEQNLAPVSELAGILQSGDLELLAAEYADRLISKEMRKGSKHVSPILASELESIEAVANSIDANEFEYLVGRHMIGVWR